MLKHLNVTLYAGLVHGIASVARAEGMRGLYSGLGPTLLAIAPFMAVQQVGQTLVIYTV